MVMGMSPAGQDSADLARAWRVPGATGTDLRSTGARYEAIAGGVSP